MNSKQDRNSSWAQHLQQSGQDTSQFWGSVQLPRSLHQAGKYSASGHINNTCSTCIPAFLHALSHMHPNFNMHPRHSSQFLRASQFLLLFARTYSSIASSGHVGYIVPRVNCRVTSIALLPGPTALHATPLHTSLASKKIESGVFLCGVGLVRPVANQKLV